MNNIFTEWGLKIQVLRIWQKQKREKTFDILLLEGYLCLRCGGGGRYFWEDFISFYLFIYLFFVGGGRTIGIIHGIIIF